MSRKGSKFDNYRLSRPPKLTFRGNQFTLEAETEATSSAAKKLNTADDEIVIQTQSWLSVY